MIKVAKKRKNRGLFVDFRLFEGNFNGNRLVTRRKKIPLDEFSILFENIKTKFK